MSCIRKSYKVGDCILRASSLTKGEQAKLVSILFSTTEMEREYATKRFLAKSLVEKQRAAGLIVDPELAHLAGG